MERVPEVGEKGVPFGAGEVHEDRRDHVEGGARPAPAGQVGDLGAQPHAAAPRQRFRLGERSRRIVDGEQVEPLLRKPHAIAAFAIRYRKRRFAPAQAVGLRREERVRRRAKQITGGALALFPALEIGHLAARGLLRLQASWVIRASRPVVDGLI
jgi:hypothetical protein